MKYTLKIFKVVIICFLCVYPLDHVRSEVSDEYTVKAAFVYNFLKFVRFPHMTEEQHQALKLCIWRNLVLLEKFQTIASREISGHPIDVEVAEQKTSLEACNVVFFDKTVNGELPVILKEKSQAGVLFVGEEEEFLDLGGHINFFLERSRVRFEADIQNLDRAGLKVSSKLLKLAKVR